MSADMKFPRRQQIVSCSFLCQLRNSRNIGLTCGCLAPTCTSLYIDLSAAISVRLILLLGSRTTSALISACFAFFFFFFSG